MTTYTLTQVATRVLKDLGLLGSDETPTSEDLEWAVETVTSEILMLSDTGLPIYNGSEVIIPAAYLTSLSRRLGLALAPSFGLSDLASAQVAMPLAERPLQLLSNPNVSEPNTLTTDEGKPAGAVFNFTTGL
jgi:hypothetical protein